MMKKWISVTLALVLALSLCACGNSDTPTENNPLFTSAPAQTENAAPGQSQEPTEEEKAMLSRYAEILRELGGYPGSIGKVYPAAIKSADLGQYRQEVLAMERIDIWTETPGFLAEEYDLNEAVACDRQTFLARFTVLEDVHLGYERTKTDQLGNKTADTFLFYCDREGHFLRGDLDHYSYDIPFASDLVNQKLLGTVLEWDVLKAMNLYTNPKMQFEYNEDGTLAAIVDRPGAYENGFDNPDNNIGAITEFSYDASGKRTSASYTTSSKPAVVAEYVYDSEGNCRLENENDYLEIFYDDQGRVSMEVRGIISLSSSYVHQTVEYTYGANGAIATMVHKRYDFHGEEVEREDVYTYRYDQDKLTSVTIEVGDELYNGFVRKVGYTEEITLLYGNYYFYESGK